MKLRAKKTKTRIYLLSCVLLLLLTVISGCGESYKFEFELAELDRTIRFLETAPGQWRAEIEKVAATISDHATKVSSSVRDDVRAVVKQIEASTKGVEAFTGSLVMCLTDFFGMRVKENLEQVRDALQNKVNQLTGKPPVPVRMPKAAICVYTPSDQIDVTLDFVAREPILKVHGYNFAAANLPQAQILAGDVPIQEIASSAIVVSTPYLMQINLVGIQFLPQATRVMLTWQNLTGEPRGLPISFQPTPTPLPPPPPPTPTPPPPATSAIDVIVEEYRSPAGLSPLGGECRGIDFRYQVPPGWKVDQSQGDPGHPGIQFLNKDGTNQQAEDTLRGLNYQTDTDISIRIWSEELCGGGFGGPGAVFHHIYRIFLTE